MGLPSVSILTICIIFSVDAAYKSLKTSDNINPDAAHRPHGADVFQPFLRSNNIHSDEKPYFDTDFKIRNGHGHTNQRGTSELECPEACTMELKPVCGSDGYSYSNTCELMVSACRQGKRVYVEKEGQC